PGPAPSGSGAPGGPGHQPPTDNLTFLRGVQLTNRRGVAEFATIYPGWYQGRAIHIHVKVHIGGSIAAGAYTGGHVSHTGQFYFDEGVTEQVAKLAPYNTNTTTRITNAQDFIYANGGSAGLLALAPLRHDHPPVPGGMVGTITVAVNPAATPAPV
ncbi:MAG TPA: hypothetical protein VJT31_05730, partial [Rugosimonospora sp.]|nr:hypothetical protein [Rugosimonospora sp.]